MQSVPDFGPTYLGIVLLCIKVDAVGYPDEHVTVGDAIVLGHAYADAVASRVDHRLKMARRVVQRSQIIIAAIKTKARKDLSSLSYLVATLRNHFIFWKKHSTR